MLLGLHTGLPWQHVTSVALSPLQAAAGWEGIHWAPGPKAGSAPEGTRGRGPSGSSLVK